jgi:thiamine biosynthesis protein ThiS
MAVSLMVNGKPREIETSQKLLAFLGGLGVNLNFIAVAYNGEVLDKNDFPSVTLNEGDVLEIVRPVGGG